MKSTKLFVFLLSVVLAKKHNRHHNSHHHFHLAEILNTKENFFSKINENIQILMNKLFDSMQLAETFIHKPKIKLLLTMHYDLNNIAEKNYETYDLFKNITKVEAGDKAVNKIQLDEMVREILNENQLNLFNLPKDKYHGSGYSTHSTKQPLSEFRDSEEFKDFIKRFIGKVKMLTIDDLFKEKGSSKLFSPGQRNVKVWEPPVHIEPDWPFNFTESRRIYKGKRTNIETFPFIVSVHILGDFTCAGSIISRDLILTAASCVQLHYNNRFFRENPKTTYVRIGSDWTSRRGELVPVLEIYFYPSYDPKTLKHNLAILRLERIIKFQQRRKTKIRRIQLDRGNGNLAANTETVVILGWGATKANPVVNNFQKLTVAFLDIYHIEECKKIYSKAFITDNNFCAGFLSKGGGACNRDVGGPGIVGGLLVGIISFGAPVCGTVDAPTVFTRIGHYVHWIDPIIQMAPARYGVPKTTRMTSRAYLYYFNTLSMRTYPNLLPVDEPTTPLPLLRAHEEQNSDETVLTEILTGIREENNSIRDIIEGEVTGDYDIFTLTTKEDDIIHHPLINKTIYLIPGLHYEPGHVTPHDHSVFTKATTVNVETAHPDLLVFPTVSGVETATVPTIGITKPPTTTEIPAAYEPAHYSGFPLRTTELQNAYDVYDSNNYESSSKEKASTTTANSASVDSQESREEYIHKLNSVSYTAKSKAGSPSRSYVITQPIFLDVEPRAQSVDDYSRDVAFEI